MTNDISRGNKFIKMAVAWLMVLLMGFTLLPTGAYAATNTPGKVGIKAVKSINHNTVEIKFKKVKSAEKYQVFRATKEDGKYKRVATTGTNIIHDTSLKTGKRYYYKVRAVNAAGKKGAFGKVKSIKPRLNKVPAVTGTTESEGCVLDWEDVEGAQGYEIYKLDRDIEIYKKVDTIQTSRYVDPEAAPNTNHIYKIRAYKKVTFKETTKKGKTKQVTRTQYGNYRTIAVYYGHGTKVLTEGKVFRNLVPLGVEVIKFTDDVAPVGTSAIDFSADNDSSIIGWVSADKKILTISTQEKGAYVKANPDMSGMFKNLAIEEIDFTCLYNINARNMTGAFEGTSKLEKIIIGDKFSLKGNGNCDSGLPGRRVLYGADANGMVYMEDDVPSRPGIYYLIKPVTLTFKAFTTDDLKIAKYEDTHLTMPEGERISWLPRVEVSVDRKGYRVAWIGKDGSEIQVGDLMPEKSMEYIATWVPIKYDITYNLDGAVLETVNPPYYTIESEEITLNNPTKTGHTFIGWTGDNGEIPQMTVKIPKGSIGAKSYTANFTKDPVVNAFVVKYNANGGEGKMSDSVFELDIRGKLTKNTFTKENYTFAGWTLNPEGTGVTYNDEASIINLAGDGEEITFYAQWLPVTP